ncbi:MAG: class I SAM-dependent methyltransferase [Silicimonas sp.]|nr:class I SAM-dependent methyltransferase [Silicimonas sp.]
MTTSNPDGVFDARVAESYDRDHENTKPSQIAVTVDCLTELACGGSALEFAVGTGRIALPLAARGVPVSGIELSRAMKSKLREKPGGETLDVMIGDMASVRLEGDFSLVFLVFNTICNLTTQDQQVACFRNAAAHLSPNGRFVIEVDLPPLQHLPFGETRRAFACAPDHFGIDEFDITTQRFASHHVWRKETGSKYLTVPFRYVWPAELDLMAKLAGLELENRWESWEKAPFTNKSTAHVSVWRKPT